MNYSNKLALFATFIFCIFAQSNMDCSGSAAKIMNLQMTINLDVLKKLTDEQKSVLGGTLNRLINEVIEMRVQLRKADDRVSDAENKFKPEYEKVSRSEIETFGIKMINLVTEIDNNMLVGMRTNSKPLPNATIPLIPIATIEGTECLCSSCCSCCNEEEEGECCCEGESDCDEGEAKEIGFEEYSKNFKQSLFEIEAGLEKIKILLKGPLKILPKAKEKYTDVTMKMKK